MKKILAALFGLAMLAPTAAMAEESSATLSAECEWKASISCEATCNPSASYFQCDVDPPDCSAKIPTECKAEVEASASCSIESCSASCEAQCKADPPSFSCTGECQAKLEAECNAKIDANCQSRCASDANKASCESSCKSELQGTCKGSGSASCDAQCTGTKGSADCKGSCDASCKGSCDANAKARATCDGYLKCKSPLKVKCQTDFSANCKGKCETSGGALVCNGQVVSFGDLNTVKAWFESHGYANGSSSASCSGNTCEAKAEGEAGVSCSATTAPVGSGTGAALGLLAVGYAASQLRRRKRALPPAVPVGYTPTMLAVHRRLPAPPPGLGAALFALLFLLLPRVASAASSPGGDSFTQALEKGPIYAGLAALVGGFLVSLTPCVYPMIAITVSVFGAHEAKSRWQAASLSTVFVLGIAAMFTPLGVAAGLTGSAFGTALASKWVVFGIAILFLALAASLFGAFEFVLPESLMQRLSAVGGVGYGGAFLLGLVSGIVAAPCTGPVLTGILLWIGKTQSAALGAGALFAFSLGLGIPFWLVGTFAVNLPKSGRWMVYIKSIFGIVMTIAALYYLRNPFPVLMAPVQTTTTFALICVGIIVVGLLLGAVHLGFDDPRPSAKLRKALGIVAAVAGGFFLVGWTLAPRGEFHWVHSEQEGIQAAKTEQKPVLLDFTATWCVACQELAKHTFTDPRVRAEADRFVTIKVDATNDDDPKVEAILKRYKVAGLPTVVLLDKQGNEKHRFVDFVKADDFYEVIRTIE